MTSFPDKTASGLLQWLSETPHILSSRTIDVERLPQTDPFGRALPGKTCLCLTLRDYDTQGKLIRQFEGRGESILGSLEDLRVVEDLRVDPRLPVAR